MEASASSRAWTNPAGRGGAGDAARDAAAEMDRTGRSAFLCGERRSSASSKEASAAASAAATASAAASTARVSSADGGARGRGWGTTSGTRGPLCGVPAREMSSISVEGVAAVATGGERSSSSGSESDSESDSESRRMVRGGVALGGVTSTPARAHAASTRRIWSSARAEAMRRRGDARISARLAASAAETSARAARARALHPRYSAWILVAARCSSAVAGGTSRTSVGVGPRLGGTSDDARAPERRFTSFAPCVREEEGGQCRARTVGSKRGTRILEMWGAAPDGGERRGMRDRRTPEAGLVRCSRERHRERSPPRARVVARRSPCPRWTRRTRRAPWRWTSRACRWRHRPGDSRRRPRSDAGRLRSDERRGRHRRRSSVRARERRGL